MFSAMAGALNQVGEQLGLEGAGEGAGAGEEGDALGQLWGAAGRLAGQGGEQVARSVAEVAGEGADLVNSVARTDWARELGEFGQGLQGEATLVADAVAEDPMARCASPPRPLNPA